MVGEVTGKRGPIYIESYRLLWGHFKVPVREIAKDIDQPLLTKR